ncbi:MAG: 3-beta hydroxysteroid dehydrogenase, partial [Spirulinaceae cyanobacterium]
VHYNPKDFDFGKRKAFPLRLQHFFAAIDKGKTELAWQPEFDLVSGLKDSFVNDFQANNQGKAEVDFSTDDEIL